ncbi:uncharacterized protein LOC135586588 isoform X2 [Musa acuminata AAA Group]
MVAEMQPSSQDSHDIRNNHQNTLVTEAASGQDPGSSTFADSKSKKVSHADIELVQNLIERCLQLYMNKGEVVRTLSNRARIEPGFTALAIGTVRTELYRVISSISTYDTWEARQCATCTGLLLDRYILPISSVWQKLEEENPEFFRAYYIRLKLKKQIILFNQLLEHQYHLMKYPIPFKVPLVPMQNGIHPVHVNNLPMGYPVLQPQILTTGQLHVDPMACGLSDYHVVNGIPAPGSSHPIRMNTGNDDTSEAAPLAPQCSTMSPMSEMAVTSASVESNQFSFTPSEITMGMDASAIDTTFTPDVFNTGGLQLGADGVTSSRDSIRSLGQLWNFSLSDLTADMTNLGDFGALGGYSGSPFLPSDSDILLDSPDQDDLVEYFADSITGKCAQSNEDK